jgi:shikimate kinase
MGRDSLFNVILIGMPGSGKSTVGRQLAKNIGWQSVDADTELEQTLGHSIREHFERFGEASFRDHEQRLLERLAQDSAGRIVLSTGGGAVLREANRTAIKANGNHVVYLRASVDDLVRRLRHDQQRPLLQGVDHAQRLQQLFDVRDPIYRQLADVVVDTGRSTVPAIAHFLATELNLSGASVPGWRA